MRQLLLADIHFKLGQKNVPKDWAKKRYRMFFDQVAEIEDSVDEIIIPGDIFDRVPTLEELDLYFEFISERTKRTLISTGNHEATKKGKSFFSNLKNASERINPNVQIIVDSIYETNDYYIVPYEFIKDKKLWDDLDAHKYVFTHVRGEIPPHVKPEIDLDWLSKFPIVFAGDLHSHSNTQRNIVYPGSPMTTSFHRSEVQTGYIIIDNWNWTWHPFDLPQLIRKTISDTEDMVKTDFHHTIYELEGNIKELSRLDHNELLDKKLIKRNSDTALVLDKKMTIEEELSEYLLYIMELSDIEVEEIMGAFNEYSNHTKNKVG